MEIHEGVENAAELGEKCGFRTIENTEQWNDFRTGVCDEHRGMMKIAVQEAVGQRRCPPILSSLKRRKHMKKRVLSLLLVAAALLGLFPGTALAATPCPVTLSLESGGKALPLTEAGTLTDEGGYNNTATVYTVSVPSDTAQVYVNGDDIYCASLYTAGQGDGFAWTEFDSNPVSISFAENTYLVVCDWSYIWYAFQFQSPATDPSAAPTISADLSTAQVNYTYGNAAAPLSVAAAASGTLSYQWQVSTTSAGEGFEKIEGATSASYTPPTDRVGDFWYKVSVSNTEEGKSKTTVDSAVTPVRVSAPEGKTPVSITVPAGYSSAQPLTFTLKDSQDAAVTLPSATADSDQCPRYDMFLDPGTYTYEAAVTKETASYRVGTGTIAVGQDTVELVYAMGYVYCTNSNSWTAADFTVELTEGETSYAPGDPYKAASYMGYPFFFEVGSATHTCTYTIKPSDARAAEGYQSVSGSLSVKKSKDAKTANNNNKMAQVVQTTFTVPKGAEVTVTTKPAKPYTSGTPVTDPIYAAGGDGDSYTFALTAGTTYIYRAEAAGLLTAAGQVNASTTAAAFDLRDKMNATSPQGIDRTGGTDGLDTADIRLNGVDHTGSLSLATGAAKQLTPLRMWQIANSFTAGSTSAYALEPDFHYTVVDENGGSSDVVTVSDTGLITARHSGTAIVLVTYDAIHVDAWGWPVNANRTFSAIWPENTGVVVVTVDQPAGSGTNMTIHTNDVSSYKVSKGALDAELDVLYYAGDGGYDYTFTPPAGSTVTLLRPTLTATAMGYSGGFSTAGVTTGAASGSVTLNLTEGKNIVRVTDSSGHASYQVVTVKRADDPVISNVSNPGLPIQPGDTVQVALRSVYAPANYMGYLYNLSTIVQYTTSGGTTVSGTRPSSSTARYQFDGTGGDICRTFTVTIPENWNTSSYQLTGGVLSVTGNSKELGTHHSNDLTTMGSAVTGRSTAVLLGALPDLAIPVQAAKNQVSFAVKNGDGKSLDGCTVTLTRGDGTTVKQTADTPVTLTYGTWDYVVHQAGYLAARGTLTLAEDSPAEQTLSVTMGASSANAWDGLTVTEPTKTDGVYQVATGAQLAWVAQRVNSDKVSSSAPLKAALTEDIDLADYDWTPIGGGAAGKVFYGVFDGQGHKIKNLHVDLTGQENAGLFGSVSGSNVTGGTAIRNLTIESGSVTVSGSSVTRVGGIVGNVSASGVTIENCVNKASVTIHTDASTARAGGIAGCLGVNGNTGISVRNCANFGAITSGTYTDKAGSNYAGRVGGIAGETLGTASVNGCSNAGSITSSGVAGGIVGYMNAGSLADVYNTGAVAGGGSVGGLVGNLNAALSGAYSATLPTPAPGAAVSNGLGGAIGKVNTNATLTHVYYYSGTQGTASGVGTGTPASGEAVGKTLGGIQALTSADLGGSFLSDAANINQGYPILVWQADLTGIGIKHTPSKTTYTVGDTLDLSGLVVEGTVDGRQVTLNNSALTVAPTVLSAEGTQTITVSYGAFSDTFTVAVNAYVPPDPGSISIETTLVDGMTQRGSRRTVDVIARDPNGDKIPVKDVTVQLNGVVVPYTWDDTTKTSYTLNFTRAGENTVTISALTKTVTYTVTYEAAKAGEVIGQAVFSMEAFTLGGGYIIAPCYVDVIEGENGAQLLKRILDENGLTMTYTGQLESGFYLASVTSSSLSAIDPTGHSVPEVLSRRLGDSLSDRDHPESLGEFDHTSGSGWMYCVNSVFPNVGFSDCYLGEGDVMRVQFTLALGSDIGGGYAAGTSSSSYYTIANKDELTGKIAQIGVEKVPQSVLDVVQKLNATQSEVDQAIQALAAGAATETAPGGSDGASATLTPEATVNSRGEASVEMSSTDMAEILAAAQQDGAAAIVIEPEIKGDAAKVAVELPTSSVKDIVSGTSAALVIDTPIAAVSIPNDTLANIAAQAGGSDITAAVEHGTAADIADETIPDDAVIVGVTIRSGGKEITSFGGNALTISIPVSSTFVEGKHYKCLQISADGTKQTHICKCVMTDGALSVQVNTTHLSTFVIFSETVLPFTDVAETDYFSEAVEWAVEKGITNGTSETTFSPDAGCTRAEMVTFLWRAAGSPEPAGKASAFTDVTEDPIYFKALLWAVESGITNGTSATTFSPDAFCTRSQMAAFLYRSAQSPAVEGTISFADVRDSDDYSDAVVWAAERGITLGTGGNNFSPDVICSRGQMVTFLYRYLAE
jgi:hypothetical protein